MIIETTLYLEANGMPFKAPVMFDTKTGKATRIGSGYSGDAHLWDDCQYKQVKFHELEDGRFLFTPLIQAHRTTLRTFNIIVNSVNEFRPHKETIGMEGKPYMKKIGPLGINTHFFDTTTQNKTHKIVLGDFSSSAFLVCSGLSIVQI